MAKNEITVIDDKKFQLSINNELAAALSEELDGLGAPTLYQIKVPAGGGLAFEIGTGDPDRPDMATEIEGIIIDHHPVNAYWKNPFVSGGEKPDCSSMDGKTGLDAGSGELVACAGCKFNQYGTDLKGGLGKACKNMRRIYFLRSGDMMPMLISAPPTSLRAIKNYIQMLIMNMGLTKSYQALTKLTLKKETNSDGTPYSQIVFTFMGVLEKGLMDSVAQYADSLKSMNRTIEVRPDEYNTGGNQKNTAENTSDSGIIGGDPVPDADLPEAFIKAQV